MGSRVRRRWALPLLLVLHSSAALGHGGAPLTTRAQRQDGRLYLPTQYWGIFVGTDGGPWRWICDEAINDFALREVYSGLDGTLYATAFPGLSISRDGGCTFTAHAVLGRPGNNPLCYFRAQSLKKQGKRERLVLKQSAPGLPFDNGRFELVEEPFDAPDPKPPTPRELVKKRAPTS